MIQRAQSSDPKVCELLRRHPRVVGVELFPGPHLQFVQDGWTRSVVVGQPQMEVAGIVELMDNNPLVCADGASVPDPISTLALIALGPLARAGLIREAPAILASEPFSEPAVQHWLVSVGWNGGISALAPDSAYPSGGVAITAMAVIDPHGSMDDLDDLYEEAYGRSFLVRRDENLDWDISLVVGKPHAIYRMRITPDEPYSLLTIQAFADHDGKCGAAQVVHCMNVMAGFEETLGLS